MSKIYLYLIFCICILYLNYISQDNDNNDSKKNAHYRYENLIFFNYTDINIPEKNTTLIPFNYTDINITEKNENLKKESTFGPNHTRWRNNVYINEDGLLPYALC